MSDYGFIYILSNQSMPNLYKIGKTERSPTKRAIELSASSGVPTPFSVLIFAESNSINEYEYYLHNIYEKYRSNEKREFFEFGKKFILNDIYQEFKCISSHIVVTSEFYSLEWEFNSRPKLVRV